MNQGDRYKRTVPKVCPQKDRPQSLPQVWIICKIIRTVIWKLNVLNDGAETMS